MNKDITYKFGDLVIYDKKPARIIAFTPNGRGVILKQAGKVYVSTVKENIKPYTGDGDAVSLGLQ